MIFESDTYLCNLKDRESSKKIRDYNECFKRGILMCQEILYYLVIGNYSASLNMVKDKSNRFCLNDEEKEKYKAIKRLLESIRVHIKSIPPLFITPHIFTKFIHKLRNRNIDKRDFRNILDSLKYDLDYIKEEEIKKEEIIDFDNFKNKYLGISETALLILKKRKQEPCILSLSGKISEVHEKEKGFLRVDFFDVISFVNEEERKNLII